MPHKNVSNMLLEQYPSSIDNSITQKTKTVKNDTVINKDMQNDVNYAEEIKIKKELHNRIQNTILSKNSRKNTYLGNVNEKIASKVKKLYGIDVFGRNHIISDNDIRRIIKQHGNLELEKTKGQIAVITKDIEKIPEIINNYDKITKGNTNKNHLNNNEF